MGSSNTIAVIPARGGSKSIPRKNITDLGGKPLISWPIKIAKSIKEIDRIIVSTDDEEIAAIAHKYGAEVMLRPFELATDETPTLPVLQHVVYELKRKEKYKVDNIVLLYATSPFLNPTRLKEGLNYLTQRGVYSAVGVKEIKGKIWSFNSKTSTYLPIYPKRPLNRQYFVPWLQEAGNIYLTKAEVLIKQNRLIDPNHCKFIEVEEDECLDIDNPSDLLEARKRVT